MKPPKPRIAVTMGDAAGVGPEVALKALASPGLAEISSPLLIGDPRVFSALLADLGLDLRLRTTTDPLPGRSRDGEIPVLPLEDPPAALPAPGRVDSAWARAAMLAVARGVELVRSGGADALVTAPLNKEGIRRAGYRFQGHTDYLAYLTGAREVRMMLAGGGIRVVLATIHVPLSEVSRLLTREGIVRTAVLAREALLRFGIGSPRIAVAGLNPHAGEGGLFGREELEVIGPAVGDCRARGLEVEGPVPPDTLFHGLLRGRWDAAVVMYHDQGLIPLKMVAFETGVNVTLGLPIVRTSPDHGTAYDIAGRGTADPSSMIEAIRTACLLAAPAAGEPSSP